MHLTQSIFRSYSALSVWVAGIVFGLSAVAAAQTAAKQETKPAETNPIVLSVQASPPTTPSQLARAIQMMMDISRDDLANQYIAQLNQVATDDAGWYAVLREIGSDFVLRLSMNDRVQPAGRQLADKILTAAGRHANDPARLAELTQQVADANIVTRSAALENLQALGEVGAAALLNALADASRAADQKLLFEALRRCGAAAEQPILGGILSANARLRLAAVQAAQHLNSDQAVAALLRSALAADVEPDVQRAARQSLTSLIGSLPDVAGAEQILTRNVEQRLFSQPQRGDQVLALRRIWRTHPRSLQLVELRRSQLVVQRIEAAERAEDLIKTRPDSPANQRLYALALIEAAKQVRGFEINVGGSDEMNFARQAGPEYMEQVLAEALRLELVGAAAGSCEILGQIGDQRLLSGTSVRPLVQAASHADRRVQFAACQAIMAIDPEASFPGSSSVAEAIVSLAQSNGRAKVLVGHPDSTEAQNLAAVIKQIGFDADTATSGRDLLRLASQDPDIEYLLLADTLGSPTAQDLIYHLRTHPHTKRLPIALQYRADTVEIAWQAGAARALVDIYLVVDTRRFEDYDEWLRRMRGLADVRMPLLLIVKPNDTDIAKGWAARDPQVRFVELNPGLSVISKGLPEKVAEEFRLSRTPVSLVLEPRTVSGSQVEVTASLVLDPGHWLLWPKWTKQLHDNLLTNRITVIRASEAGLEQTTTADLLADQTAEENVIKIDDIDFLYSRVTDLLSNQESLTESYIDPKSETRARRFELDDSRTIAMPWTLDRILVARQMDRLIQMAPAAPISGSQRRVFANQAMDWLAQISSAPERYPFWELGQYDLLIGQVANTPQLNVGICQTLGNLGTPSAQQQLADIASQNQLSIEIRQAAVAALQHAFERRGILLTTEQIQRQYDRYNAAENLPEESQQVLSAILNAIERPTSTSQK